MKLFYTTIALFFFLQNVNSQIPDYFGNNPSWFVSVEGGGGAGVNYYSYSYVLYVKGDSTVQGQTYHQLYARGYDDNNGTIPPWSAPYFDHLHMLVRQEGRSMRYWDEPTQTDSLLINYDLTVGDALQGMVFAYDPMIVEEVDSVLIGSEYRRVLKMDTSSNYFNAVIEGVVEVSYLDSIFPTNTFGASVFRHYEMLGIEHIPFVCYGQNDVVLWPGNGMNCSLTLDTPEIETTSPKIWFDAQNKVIKTEGYNGKLVVFNAMGQEMKRGNSSGLSTDDMVSGVYFVQLESGTRHQFILIY